MIHVCDACILHAKQNSLAVKIVQGQSEALATVNGYIRSKSFTVYGKSFKGENFHSFRDFLLNLECFTSNNLLAIGIHYQEELLPQKFSCEHSFSILTAKVFPLECFAVYDISRI